MNKLTFWVDIMNLHALPAIEEKLKEIGFEVVVYKFVTSAEITISTKELMSAELAFSIGTLVGQIQTIALR
jgi:hypothetical protein